MLFYRFFAKVDYPELTLTIQHLLDDLDVTDFCLLEAQPATYKQPYRHTLQGQFRGNVFTLSMEQSALKTEPRLERLELSLVCANPEWQRWVIAPAACFQQEAQRRLDIKAHDLGLPVIIGSNAATSIDALAVSVQRYAALWQLLGASTIVLERERLMATLPWLPHQHHQQTALRRLFEWLDQLRRVAAEPFKVAER